MICPYCSNEIVKVHHQGVCPRVESIDYHLNGTVKTVRFRPEHKEEAHADQVKIYDTSR